jgi:hypothetical protein
VQVEKTTVKRPGTRNRRQQSNDVENSIEHYSFENMRNLTPQPPLHSVERGKDLSPSPFYGEEAGG